MASTSLAEYCEENPSYCGNGVLSTFWAWVSYALQWLQRVAAGGGATNVWKLGVLVLVIIVPPLLGVLWVSRCPAQKDNDDNVL